MKAHMNTLASKLTFNPKKHVFKKLYTLLFTLSLAGVSTQASAKSMKYTVKNGDTLSKIAHQNHTTVSKVRKANGMKKKDLLKSGYVINLPQKNTLTKKHLTSFLNLNKCKIARTKLGKRYIWGASGRKNTYDCSSFTKFVYRMNGINIPRTSINQSKYGKYVKRSQLKKGDLIFFDTSKKRKGYVNHVGIYLGNNMFIHASSAKKKVIITSLNKKFYSQRYKGARRPS